MIIPASLEPDVHRRLVDAAISVYRVLRCTGVARIDFFLRGDQLVFNEINTMPGMRRESSYPQMLGAVGIGYADMIDILAEDALKRNR